MHGGYLISLSGLGSWILTSSLETRPWLSRLAEILELKKYSQGISAREICFREMGGKSVFRDGQMIFESEQWCRLWAPKQATGPVCFEIDINNGSDDVRVIQMWPSLQPLYHQAISRGGLPSHAALVEANDQGLIFFGHGNAGKSTTARRLEHVWRPLCDDEALIVFDDETGYKVHPFPTWSDCLPGISRKTWNVQYSVSLNALFFLEKSPRDEVIPLDQIQAAILINRSAVQVCERFWKGMKVGDKREWSRQIFENACEMASRIPAFTLRVNLTGRFWEKVESVL